jgi:hypothetical protein
MKKDKLSSESDSLISTALLLVFFFDGKQAIWILAYHGASKTSELGRRLWRMLI